MTEVVTDADGLKVVIRGLIDGWSVDSNGIDLGQRDRRPDAHRFIALHSLAAHAHRVAEAALILIDGGRHLEAMPLIRITFESAITAMWLAQNEEGGRAFMSEFSRQQRAAQHAIDKSPSAILADRNVTLPHTDMPGLESNSEAQARIFEQMCNDFEVGADLYVYYRVMSSYAHAGLKVVDEYVLPTESSDDVAAMLNVSRYDPGGLWLFFLAVSLVWAGTAFDYIEVTRSRRAELRAAAKAIGAARDLHLTSAALHRTSTRTKQPKQTSRQRKP